MFKWRGAEGEPSDPLRPKVVSFTRRFLDASEGGDGGFEVRGVLEGETRYLARLHSHCSSLAAGAGYAAHSDDHDLAILVLEGAVETLGEAGFREWGGVHSGRCPTRNERIPENLRRDTWSSNFTDDSVQLPRFFNASKKPHRLSILSSRTK